MVINNAHCGTTGVTGTGRAPGDTDVRQPSAGVAGAGGRLGKGAYALDSPHQSPIERSPDSDISGIDHDRGRGSGQHTSHIYYNERCVLGFASPPALPTPASGRTDALLFVGEKANKRHSTDYSGHHHIVDHRRSVHSNGLIDEDMPDAVVPVKPRLTGRRPLHGDDSGHTPDDTGLLPHAGAGKTLSGGELLNGLEDGRLDRTLWLQREQELYVQAMRLKRM
ncbi:hypothetical protein PoB_002585700 [Plakobranchus ocellatus]|uniref:Uncharacterized protein n=1 Tax=Plakobranchus ocellatus TaxID=259542 RepID=A0AAV3ZXR4_9GAST|nr:hypothetical protein PoB_002585700 [Plakobranchus ocellatus]